MTIDKVRFASSLKNIRGLYQHHEAGEFSTSSFITKARAELNALYMQHTRRLIEATAARFIGEIWFFQTQFGLDLECEKVYLTRVTRGYRGIRASLYIRNKVYKHYPGLTEVFIGPFDEWDKIAIHTVDEREFGSRPSFYTKRRRNRWQDVQNFNFPDLLQWIKEEVERPEPEYDEDDVPF
jgi:hypothetical protein